MAYVIFISVLPLFSYWVVVYYFVDRSQLTADTNSFSLFESDLLSFSRNARSTHQDYSSRSVGLLPGTLSQTSAPGLILRTQLMQSSSAATYGKLYYFIISSKF